MSEPSMDVWHRTAVARALPIALDGFNDVDGERGGQAHDR